jgi:hypothetical protein
MLMRGFSFTAISNYSRIDIDNCKRVISHISTFLVRKKLVNWELLNKYVIKV